MNIKNKKILTEKVVGWTGETGYGDDDGTFAYYYVWINGRKFLLTEWSPDLETGRHHLVELENKLSPEQFEKYDALLYEVYLKEIPRPNYNKWFKTAPAKLCFEKIMEVI